MRAFSSKLWVGDIYVGLGIVILPLNIIIYMDIEKELEGPSCKFQIAIATARCVILPTIGNSYNNVKILQCKNFIHISYLN